MHLRDNFLLKLSQYRFYWWSKATLDRLIFFVKAKIFGVKYGLIEEKTNFRAIRQIISDVLIPLIVAGGFAVFLQVVDPYLHPVYQKIDISIPDDGDYVTFLATVSGIGGVFIGLYYAGISVVGSAMYARVPNNVRDLLAHERIGSLYMRILSFLTTLGLILIAFRISGQPRVYLVVPVVTVLAGIGVIAFVKLGQRAFYLFDPTRLSIHIFEQLSRGLGQVKVGGYQWLDKSFQKHAQRQASRALDTLETLVDITEKEPHLNRKPFVDLSKNLSVFLMHYEQSKRSIPTDSAWFAQTVQYRDWYRTEEFQVHIAHNTGTNLQPEATTNKDWVEDRVLPILNRCIAINLEKGNYSELIELFRSIDRYTRSLAQLGEVRRAFDILDELLSDVLCQITQNRKKEAENDEMLEKMLLVESLASFPITMALNFDNHSKLSNRSHIEKSLASIRWNTNTSIYRKNFPVYCLERLEWFRPRLDFEKKVDGKYITPFWYRSELVCQVVAERFVENTKMLISTASEIYSKTVSEELLENHPWLAAAIISREWEYWHKVANQMDNWEDMWGDLVAARKIDGLVWPTFDFEKLRAVYEERQIRILILMSEQSLLLARLPRPQSFPDYAGQFLHTAGETTFEALLSNKVEILKHIFESYLRGCLFVFKEYCPNTSDVNWKVKQELKIACAAILDVMTISGYAKLLADYHGNDALWQIITVVWDKIQNETDETSLISVLANAVSIVTAVPLEMPHRSQMRFNWLQKIKHELRKIPRHEEYRGGWGGSTTVIDHDSALVRIFARKYTASLFDGVDVFITFYLINVDGVDYFDFGLKGRNLQLQEQIDLEEQRIQPSDDDVDA